MTEIDGKTMTANIPKAVRYNLPVKLLIIL
jgi:hypothetical protein